MRAFAGAHGLTVGNVVGGVWGVLLGRLTGRPDVTFGSTVAGRSLAVPGIERIAGLLINTVPARVRWAPGQRLADVVAAFARDQRDTMDHEHAPLTELQRRLGTGELFDTLVVVENYPVVDVAGGDLRVTGIDVVEAPHYPVTLMVRPAAAAGPARSRRARPAGRARRRPRRGVRRRCPPGRPAAPRTGPGAATRWRRRRAGGHG